MEEEKSSNSYSKRIGIGTTKEGRVVAFFPLPFERQGRAIVFPNGKIIFLDGKNVPRATREMVAGKVKSYTAECQRNEKQAKELWQRGALFRQLAKPSVALEPLCGVDGDSPASEHTLFGRQPLQIVVDRQAGVSCKN